jgi:uncharacterized metal-binding protein
MDSCFCVACYITNINMQFNRRGNNNICMGIPDVAKNDYSSFRIINGMDSDIIIGKTIGYDTIIGKYSNLLHNLFLYD